MSALDAALRRGRVGAQDLDVQAAEGSAELRDFGSGIGTFACVVPGGVGYWATDVGTWNSNGGPGEQGTLFLCSAANTWTAYYQPYFYPHPLISLLFADGFEGGDSSLWSSTVP